MTPRDGQSGAAAVELALLLPFLMVMAFGVIELGGALNVHIGVQEAVGEGAIYAAFNPDDPDGARARVVDAVSSPALSLSQVSVTCPSADEIRVVVTHQHDLFTPVLSNLLGSSLSLSADATETVLSTTSSCTASP